VARELDVTDVCRVIQRRDVVVLEDPRGIEQVNELSRGVIKVCDYILDLALKRSSLDKGVAGGAEAFP